MQCAVDLVNSCVTALFNPNPLPKLDFSKGIPADCTTVVAVPTLLLNEAQVKSLLEDLEVRYLANRDPHLLFALLTDLPDAVSKPHANDAHELVELAMKGIDDLNAKYEPERRGCFILLHRHRIFSARQGVWMGWERKRGKLLDFNKLLMGEYDAFPIKAGCVDALKPARYVLTLDSDTQLPRGAAARMVGTIAHPSIRPSFIPGCALSQKVMEFCNPVSASAFVRLHAHASPRSTQARAALTSTAAPSPMPTRTCTEKESSPAKVSMK
jgi:cyclic beta-1,2-glucan synthetase